MAQAQGGILAHSARHARALLDSPRDLTVLHGDVHHDNILDFGERAYLADDPVPQIERMKAAIKDAKDFSDI